MSTTAITVLKNELRGAEEELKQQQANSAEAIELGRRAQRIVDLAQKRVNDLTEGIVNLEQIEREKGREVTGDGGK